VPREDGGEMRLHVSPDGPGPVEVRVVVQADGVQAALTAHQDHARQALEAHRPSREAALGRSNLRLEGFNVALGQHGADSGRDLREQAQAGAALRGVPAPALSAAAAASSEPIRPTTALGGLSLRA
jgi:flagellar hook-length control protein FliK